MQPQSCVRVGREGGREPARHMPAGAPSCTPQGAQLTSPPRYIVPPVPVQHDSGPPSPSLSLCLRPGKTEKDACEKRMLPSYLAEAEGQGDTKLPCQNVAESADGAWLCEESGHQEH